MTSSRRVRSLARLTATGLLATGLALGVAAASDASPGVGAMAVISQTVDEVLAVLRDRSKTPQERRRGIEQIAYARFDLHTMSRLVLARNWRKFSDSQKDEYIREFKLYLANNYGERIDRYDQEDVEVLGERPEARGDVTVKTKIVGGEYTDATVDYRMRQKDGEWKVIDVIVEGISLVSNYRDQFKEVVSREGPDGLLKRLRDKNAKGDTTDL